MSATLAYPGSELELFREARNWKRYYAAVLRPFIGRRVLEVGAGIGASTKVLSDGSQELWLCLEPDRTLAAELRRQCGEGTLPACCAVEVGGLADLAGDSTFDTILYIDVLEHIEGDEDEVARAGRHLRKGGRLVVLAPAHQWLFSPFDESVGHFRRYCRRDLLGLAPPGLVPAESRYLDAVGLLASLANRLLLRSRLPSLDQILVWDRLMVPLSRLLDPLLAYRVGKSVVVVWQRQ